MYALYAVFNSGSTIKGFHYQTRWTKCGDHKCIYPQPDSQNKGWQHFANLGYVAMLVFCVQFSITRCDDNVLVVPVGTGTKNTWFTLPGSVGTNTLEIVRIFFSATQHNHVMKVSSYTWDVIVI